MNAQSIPVVAMAGISLYVGCYHLLIYLRRRQHREDLTFALLCLATCLYNVFCIGLYNSSTVAASVPWQRAQLIALALFVTAFLWFVSDYTRQKPGPVLYAFTAFYLLAIFVQLVDRSNLTWVIDPPSIKEIQFSSNFKVVYHEATFGPFTAVQSLVGLAASAYILVSGIRFYQRGYRREAKPLLVAIGIMLVAALNDTAVGNGLYQFVYVIEYGYMAVILLMAYSLSNTIVEAAIDKESLRAAEERFRALIETTSDWVWETDQSGIYTYTSPTIQDLLGYEPQEVVGKTFFDFVPPAEVQQTRAAFQAITDGSRPVRRLENTVQRKDGRRVVLETSRVPFFDAQGKLLGYRGIDRDITERRQAEEALRESEQKYRSFVEESSEGFVLTDEEGRIVEWNRAQERITGLRREDVIGTPLWDIQLQVLVPEHRVGASSESLRAAIQQILQTGASPSFARMAEVEVCQPDGQRVLIEQAAFPIKFDQGYRLGSVVRDVTARNRTEAALAHERDLLQALMDSLPDAIYFKNLASQFTRINKAQAQLLGLAAPDTAIGKTDFGFFPADLCHLYFTEEQQLMQTGQPVLDRLEFNPALDGQPRWLAATKAPIRDVAGRIVGLVGVSRDVTDRVMAQERADTTSRSLRAVIEIAHELIGCTDIDLLCRRAVELARAKLNVERCGLFLLDEAGMLRGTYGTDLQRQTTDEHARQLSPTQHRDFDVAAEQLWTIFETEQAYQANLERKVVGTGWTGSTLIRTRERTIGVMYNDTAISHAPVNEAQQEVLAVYCSLLGSLIELKRAEGALRRTQFAVDLARDAIHWVNAEGRLIYVNDSMCKALGYTREELLGMMVFDIDPAFPRETWRDHWQQMSALRSSQFEGVHQAKDGHVFPVEISVNVMAFEGEEIHCDYVRDITERKQAEEALRQSRNLLQVVLDTIPVRVFWKDRDLRYLGCNQPFALDAGLQSPEELIGKDDYQMSWREQAELYRGDDRQVLESGQPKLGYEEPQTTPAARRTWLRTNKVPLRDPDGSIWGVLGTYEDITERKQVEQILQLRVRLTEFAAAHSLAELLQKTLDEVDELTNSPIGFYHFVEADQRNLSLQAWSTRTLAEFCQAEGEGLHYPLDQAGVWTDCVRERRPVIHNDYATLPHRKGMPDGHAQVTRELVVPILRGERIVAILGVGNKPQPYTDKDTEIVSYAADLAWEITERKQAEEALRVSEERYRRLVEASPVAMWINQEGIITYMNPAALRILGAADLQQVVGHAALDFVHPDYHTIVNTRISEMVEHELIVPLLEEKYIRLDGSAVDVEVIATPFMTTSGRAMQVLFQDITVRKQAEAQIERALRETRVRFEVSQALAGRETEDAVLDVLIQHAGLYPLAFVVIFTFDRREGESVAILRRQNPYDSGLTAALPGGTSLPMSRYTLFEHLSADWPFISADVRVDERFELAGREILQQTGAVSYAAIPLTVGNEWLGYIAAMAQPVGYFDEEKQHLYLTLAEQGAVALRAARLREAIRDSQQRLSLLVQQSPLAVIEWNTNFEVVSWNPAAERIFGYTRDEARGRRAADLIVPIQAQPLIDQTWQALLTQQGSTYSTNENLTKAGQSITCEWFNAPLVGAGGRVIGAASLVQDITERRRAEAERENLIRELEAKNAELERFTYTASHDLKSPLVTIRGFLGFLEKDIASGNLDQSKADLERIRNATDRMQRLLSELLELSRIGRIMNPPEVVPFAAIVHEALDLLQGRIAARGVQIDVQPELPIVQGDRLRLVEVVQNLVDNACKFMGDQPMPHITIGCRGADRDGKPILFVRDNGIGIDPQYHQQVFGLFDKLDPQAEGTGIGLALVKRIVEVHGGRIWIESTRAQAGATFCFTLPMPAATT